MRVEKFKSSHHKDENTFHFQTFHERLANVNIDVARKLGKFSSTPEDADTFFSEALDKWSDLNCTRHFVDFRKEITGEVQTFVQLIHHQKDVVDSLQKHLRVENSLAIEPLLNLVVQLARDLQGDFYPYFKQFFEICVWLLSVRHHDVEVLEQTFTCLAYIFKFLWRLMLKDMENLYGLFSPLLGQQYKDYIQTFASECFSFLMRKVKDKSQLMDFMFQSLADNPDQAQGVGTLLFEMTKGVKNQFHSITEQVLPVMLTKLGEDKLPQEEVEVSLKQTFTLMAGHSNQEHSSVLLSALLEHVATVHTELESGPTSVCQSNFLVTLSLIEILIKHRNGGLVGKGSRIVEVLSRLVQGSVLPGQCASKLLDVVAALLMASRATLEAQHRPRLIQLVYRSVFGRKFILHFTRQVFDLPLFEKDLLPALLTYCSQQCDECEATDDTPDRNHLPYRDILEVAVSLCTHKVPPWMGVMEGKCLKSYLLDFNRVIKSKMKDSNVSEKSKFSTWVCSSLNRLNGPITTQEQLRDVWLCVYMVPRIKPIEKAECVELLRKVIVQLQTDILERKSTENSGLMEGTLTEAVISLFHLLNQKEFIASLSDVIKIKELISLNATSVSVLRLADLYYSTLHLLDSTHRDLSEEEFSDIYTHLQFNLSSPHHQVRLLTLHICCQFDLPLPTLPEDKQDVPQPGVFTICLSAEEIKPHMNTYREILMHLRKLDYDLIQSQLPLGDYSLVPLRYLLGQLYSHIVLMWDPVLELIQSHAHNLDIDSFWQVYRPCLEETATHTESLLHSSPRKQHFNTSSLMETSSVIIEDSPEAAVDMDKYMRDWVNTGGTVNWQTYRQQLWKAMVRFPATCEARTRILTPLLFRFIENEYDPEDLTATKFQDVRKPELKASSSESFLEADQLDTTEHESDTEDDKPDNTNKEEAGQESVQHRKKRASNKTLVQHLQVFAVFRDPRSCYLEPRLRQLYYNMLQHKHLAVQKVAFSCLLTYKHKYLTPYRENFDRLLDDKHFKKEIVLFSIDQEATTIQPEHRADLMPILMRVLYGKMATKTGKDTSGKNQSHVRKNIVLRFLAGSTEQELHVFFDLVFEPFLHLCQGSLLEEVNKGMNDLDITQVIPLRKQQGMLDTMEIILKKLGHLIESYLPRLLAILLCLAGQYVYLLEHRNLLPPKHVNFVKNLKQIVHSRIIQFFNTFEKYPFSRLEVDSLFTAVVWPHLEKLEYEGTYSTTGLLSLLAAWTNTSRFFPLLAKTHIDKATLSPLPHVFALLHSKQVDQSVVAMVMEMTENLLTMEDFEKTENCEVLDVGSTVQWSDNAELSFGTQLILPHVSHILAHLKSVVVKMSAEKNKRKAVPTTELTILSKLSEYVLEEEQSSVIVELLLPFLSHHVNTNTETEVHILTALKHLIGKVHRPERFWSNIACLFSALASRQTRSLLCELVAAVEAKDPAVDNLSSIVSNLNAWDPKRVEEPDYMVRLDAYQECVKTVQSSAVDELNTVFCQHVLHNCVHFLATTDDMSLRDSSSHCLQQLISKLADSGRAESHKSPLFNLLIRDNLLPQIRDKMKLKIEASRHEFINLFALLVRRFSSCPLFSDFVPLLDQNDPEMDFFNNLVHIQLHRRARALRKIGHYLSSHQMKTDSIVQYLLPLVTCYIRDEQYAKASNLLDAAVEALGALCRVLPWPRYMLLLNYYLEKLPKAVENQKLLVRVVVSILDNFHFDLKNSHKIRGAPTLALPGEAPKEVEPNESQESEEKDVEEDTQEQMTGSQIQEDEEDMLVDPGHEGENTEVVASADLVTGKPHFQQCGAGLASKIHKYIVHAILPKLHKVLTKKTHSDDVHKKAEASKFAEDEEVLRVPLALAMVKLLQTLPHGMLEANLPNVLLKVCMFLKSRANDIRITARETLVKILHSVGARFFSYILKELTAILKRGYQLHVLCYTVWALLKHIHDNDRLKPGDLDCCITDLVQVLNVELFSLVAEEKEVAGIKGKIPEARSSKSYDSYQILALYITKASLPKIIVPLKQELEKGHSHVTARKAGEVLRKLSSGLVDNKGIELDSLLTFVYGVTTESLPMLKESDKKERKNKEVDPRLQPTDTYTVTPEVKRGGKKPKTHTKTNLHVIVEFGFQVLHELLKHSRLSSADHSHLQLLDPFIEPVCDSLNAKHLKISTTALRCLTWLLKFPLPSLKTHTTSISNHIFVLLSTYAATGAARGDNFELVVMCFKTLTVLVRDVQYHCVSQEQLQVLLGYVEEDIHDYTRQATAFTLLKAILSRKLVVPEVQDVIKKVQELSVSSEQPNIRLQCRQVMSQFLLDYPLGTKLKSHLEFYIVQLNYEHESGRESALEMMATVFSSFPQRVLLEHSGLFFIPLASRLVNDDSSKCRKLASLAIKSLLVKLGSNQRDHLFNMCVSWLQESKVLMRKLAAITCGLFVEVEASAFERHLKTVLPILEHQIEPAKYQQDVSESEEKELDRLLYNLLSVLLKIIRECGLALKLKWADQLNHIWESVEDHLLYPHTWVRLVSAQLFGVLFASWSAEDLLEAAHKRQEKIVPQDTKKKSKKKKQEKTCEEIDNVETVATDSDDYMLENLELKLHNLCGLFCKQFSESELSEELAEQIIKNLVFMAKILKLKCKEDIGPTEEAEDSDQTRKTASLRWLIKRLCKEAKNESTGSPKLTLKRKSVVKWLAAVSLDLGKERVLEYVPLMLPILYREYNNNSPQADVELKTLAQEVLDLLKSLVGVETFTTYYASCQKSVLEKREGRKHKMAVEAVSNPEVTAVKKIKKNLAKREAKKRKIHEKRPTFKVKKHKEAVEES